MGLSNTDCTCTFAGGTCDLDCVSRNNTSPRTYAGGLADAAQLAFDLTEAYQHRPDGLRALDEMRASLLARVGRDPKEQGSALSLAERDRRSKASPDLTIDRLWEVADEAADLARFMREHPDDAGGIASRVEDVERALRDVPRERRPEAPPAVDWSAMTAAQVIEVSASRPLVFGPWSPWSFAAGWSRHEECPKDERNHQAIQVQPSTPGPGWSVTGFDDYGESRSAPDEESAKALADHLARERGWKLVGDDRERATP